METPSPGSWELIGCFEVLPCTEEQKMIFAAFTFEGVALMVAIEKAVGTSIAVAEIFGSIQWGIFSRNNLRLESDGVYEFEAGKDDRNGVQM